LLFRATQGFPYNVTVSARGAVASVRREVGPILPGMATRRPKKKGSTFGTELGGRLRALREKRGLTQQQVADRIGATKPRISRYEGGAVVPEAETLVLLGQVLEVSLDELLTGRAAGADDDGVRDVQLRERVRELEKVDKRYRTAALEVIDALVLKGAQEATALRLQGGTKR
jgi:transcriptional regulator with XRE-family HTH domain